MTNQQHKLDETAEELFYYVNEVWIIKDLSDKIHKKFSIASPYLNFRDALFHYKKMYEAAMKNDNATFIQQQACIQEHLNRGLKDFAVHLCANFLTRILHKMINAPARSVSNTTRPKLRHIYHRIKNVIVEIHLEGQALQHFDTNKIAWLPKVVETIESLKNLLEEEPSLKNLYENTISELIQNTWRI